MIIIIIICFSIIFIVYKTYVVLTCARCTSKVCLVGKTALVTGGSSGIGYQTVLALASRGCRVIVADKVISDDLRNAIVEETNNPNIEFKYIDLASFKSVRNFAESLKNSETKLDILINNAGVGRTVDVLSEDGLNLTMQINYFSPFLLTHLLTGLLQKSPSGRIIFTSSILAFVYLFNPMRIEAVGLNEKDNASTYSISKLYTIIAADIFAKKLQKYGITSNSFHPAFVKTGIYWTSILTKTDILTFKIWFLQLIARLIGKTPEEGAQTSIYLACANEVEDITGTFFAEQTPRSKPSGACDAKLCEHIWRTSEEIVKLTPNEQL